MEEQRLLKKQFMLHVLYNMVTFSIIFIAFGIFMLYMMRSMTFSTVDKKLEEAQHQYNDIAKVEDEALYQLFGLKPYENLIEDSQNGELFEEFGGFRKRINNPQITVIVRTADGEVLNENETGKIGDYIDQIDFSTRNLGNIYTLKINDEYSYRCLNFKSIDTRSESDEYVQLLINVDSEINLLKGYRDINIYTALMCIILSTIASFILSRKAMAPIEQTLKRQTEFVQNASHELRTPLTIIQAKQELLLQEPNAKIIDKSEDIMLSLNETKRLSKLTKDLMILVRENDIKLQKEDINVDEFIGNIILPYKDIAEAQEKIFKSNLNFGKDASIDPNKIHQLLVILLDNAIKYTEKGETIEVNTHLKDNKCIIEVKDTGIGMSNDGLNRAFERFYREDRARSRETGGSGLGLSIARMIVKSHNGSIRASHNAPKGTIFTIRLNR